MEEREHIQEELQALAPELIGLSKDMPFSVPDEYFSDLKDQSIELFVPILPVGDKSSGRPFSIPDNYFEELSGKIKERARKIESKSGSSLFSIKIIKWMPHAAAATFLGIMIYTAFLFNNPRIHIEKSQPAPNYTAMETPALYHTILNPDNEIYQAIAEKMKGISDEEMNRYLEETVSSETTEWIPEEMN